MIFAGSLKKGYVDAEYVIRLFAEKVLQSVIVTFFSVGNAVETIKIHK